MPDTAANLPEHLRERVRVVSGSTRSVSGGFVLLWIHHAVRAHENPALDVAVSAGNHLHLPVLVYQGLSGGHRFNSDRHHTFIMEGARDVTMELDDRGIAYGFHLGLDPAERGPLRRLADRAALVVTEDFPAPPFARWTQHLATETRAPVWAVDAHCIVPMRSVEESFDRAFRFRDHVQKEIQHRISRIWTDVEPEIEPYTGSLDFDPVDLAAADLSELCARCEIDHTVGPVSHTPGGSRAGYRRWNTFVEQGLEHYARLRNDAAVRPPAGVSRMSPYLHHGHVSPFRIAREAHGASNRGSGKFLDELIIWRELAFNFCCHNDHVERMAVLPRWAQDTLTAHASDPRPHRFSWEVLARGRTGNRLWDAAQRSLLVHGELHNNVRMTWGKALLPWTEDPEEALRLLIDLNHRYALDGSDPNSYGGLLWCLGLFDRPFTPEKPVYGCVRPRSIEAHARRLDLETYELHISRPARAREARVAVIGAGLSGLMSARTLQDQGMEVTIVDRGRAPGGRASSRVDGRLQFDHGAQYFTSRDARMAPYVESWLQDGVVDRWNGRIGTASTGAVTLKEAGTDRFVGTPSMQSIALHLSRDLDVRSSLSVTALRREDSRWTLYDDGDRAVFRSDIVILAMPPEQALALLPADSVLVLRLQSVRMRACWAALVAFEDRLAVQADGLFVDGTEELSWAARDSSKPGRPAIESWVLHARPDWSEARVDVPGDEIASQLLPAFYAAVGTAEGRVRYLSAHRWRYAQAASPLTDGCLWDGVRAIGVCGDWLAGSRVEGALLSGMAMAGRVMGHCRT